jgi:aryl-alcohol dehydrogenase-like predicted oxidoreductase
MKLGIGTAQFGTNYGVANQRGQVKQEEQKSILKFAQKNGIDMLDTAIDYGDSENNLGKCGVSKFKVITKIPPIPDNLINVTEWMREHINNSLLRLGTSSIYGLLLHRSSDLFKYSGKVIKFLKNLKESKLVKKIGVSIYSPDELEIILKRTSVDIVQAPFNIIDQRLQATGWLLKLNSLNIEVHTRSIFLQGLLLLPRNKIPKKFLVWKKIWDKWYEWQDKHPEFSALQACLGFANSKEINRIIIGVDSLQQIKEIVNEKKIFKKIKYPNISSNDIRLLNPSNWKNL